jgi:release factor glutamine methyltransferase
VSKPIRFADLQRHMTQILRHADCDMAALDARLLLAHIADMSDTQLALNADAPIPHGLEHKAQKLTALRAAGKPIAKIIGHKEFWGRRFQVSQAVLDPRPDSETLIEAALPLLPQAQKSVLIDLGTGSGCLLLTLLAERPAARGLGIDQSPAALHMARRNAHALNVRARVALQHGDWLHGVTAMADMIVTNPPYIESAEIARLDKAVRRYDPRCALDGGVDGLVAYRRLIEPAFARLKGGGHLLLEIGATQAAAVTGLMHAAGFEEIVLKQDLAGRDRILQGQKSSRKIKKGFEK